MRRQIQVAISTAVNFVHENRDERKDWIQSLVNRIENERAPERAQAKIKLDTRESFAVFQVTSLWFESIFHFLRSITCIDHVRSLVVYFRSVWKDNPLKCRSTDVWVSVSLSVCVWVYLLFSVYLAVNVVLHSISCAFVYSSESKSVTWISSKTKKEEPQWEWWQRWGEMYRNHLIVPSCLSKEKLINEWMTGRAREKWKVHELFFIFFSLSSLPLLFVHAFFVTLHYSALYQKHLHHKEVVISQVGERRQWREGREVRVGKSSRSIHFEICALGSGLLRRKH